MKAAETVVLAEAHAEAISAIRNLIAAELSETGIAELAGRFVEISDLQRMVLVSVPFQEAIDFSTHKP